MSVIALPRAGSNAGIFRPAVKGVVRWRALVVAFALVFPLAFYLLLLAMLVVVYGHWPNYVTPYDWIANVLHIIASTPSVSDTVPIILNEWLLETGYINYDYGRGIAEWSLSIIPHKLAIVSLVGALIGLNFGLLLGQQTTGAWSKQCIQKQCIQLCRFGLLTGGGALCASVTSATVFSVVHCATPSWVGSLAVLGFDSYNVFAVEPFGPLISGLGLAALVVSALLIVRDGRDSPLTSARQEAAPC